MRSIFIIFLSSNLLQPPTFYFFSSGLLSHPLALSHCSPHWSPSSCHLRTFTFALFLAKIIPNYLHNLTQMSAQISPSQKTVPWPGGSVAWSIIPYTKKLPVQSPVEAQMLGSQSTFLSHIDVSFSLSHSLPPPLSLKVINISLREDLKIIF